MSTIKYAKKKAKKSSFFTIIPQGDTLVEVYNTPKSIFNLFKKNSKDLHKNYSNNNN